MLNRIVAKAMLDKKGFDIVEKLLDRAHGKAKQNLDLNQNVTGATITIDGREVKNRNTE